VRPALAAFALAVVPAAAVQPSQAQDAPPDDPAARPSVVAPLAVRSLLIDLARAGNRVFAAGERGHVLYSDDEGATWTQVQVPGSANLNAVHFNDAEHGCAAGHAEMILCTWDGGKSWERTLFEPDNQQPLLDIWFADRDRGIATGAYGVIYTTTDGGRVWSQVPFEPVPLDGKVKEEEAPVDDMEAEVDLGFEFHLNAIARGAGTTVYIGAEAGRLFRSDDDGATWRELPSPYDGSFYGILPLDGDALLAFGLRGNLFRSDDGGRNWVPIETGTVALLNAGARVDTDTIVIVGMQGVQLASHDGGRTFTLHQREDRKALSAVLPARDGALIVAGENGVGRTTLPGIGGGAP